MEVTWYNLLWNVLVCGIGYQNSDSLVYQPDFPPDSRTQVPTPEVPYETVTITTKDQINLHGYLIKQENESYEYPTVIMFHGNEGNIGHRLDNVKMLYDKVKCNILLVEYRGYGLSEGTPTEVGLYLDAQAAFDFVASRPDLDTAKVILYGSSLGGAVAIDLASNAKYKHRIAGLIVENTFTSVREIAKVRSALKIDSVPKFCFKNLYESYKKIANVPCPILVISGSKDNLVPPEMSVYLYNNATGASMKKIEKFPEGGHNDTWMAKGYEKVLVKFIQEVMGKREKSSATRRNNGTNNRKKVAAAGYKIRLARGSRRSATGTAAATSSSNSNGNSRTSMGESQLFSSNPRNRLLIFSN